jgi:hypothetical protein
MGYFYRPEHASGGRGQSAEIEGHDAGNPPETRGYVFMIFYNLETSIFIRYGYDSARSKFGIYHWP